jgi:hypothetical protein
MLQRVRLVQCSRLAFAFASTVLCLVGWARRAAAAAETAPPRAKPAPPEASEKPFLIRPFLALDQLRLDLTRDEETLSFVPNTQTAVGLRLGYAGFTISASFDVAASEDPRVYGQTEYIALQLGNAFRVAERELFVAVFLQYHEGLYIETSSDILSGFAPIVLPELAVLSLGATATYYLNPEFSYDATFVEFRPRAVSIGSWTLRLSTGLMGFDNQDAPIIPEALRARFGAEGTLSESGALYVGAMGGYSLDLRLLKRWLLAGSVLVGVTVAREGHTTDLGTEQGSTVVPSAAFALALGYSGETLHTGVFGSADLESSKAGSVEEQIVRTAVTLFVGVRF